MSIELGVLFMSAPSHGSCRAAKYLKSQAKRALGLTSRRPAARTAAHPPWNAIAGVLTGCGEVAERSKAAVC
jgi:hypothetical protein